MDEHVGDLDTSTERVDDKAPERIWLQIGNWHYSIDDSGDLPTYCDEKIDDDDVEYVLATALEASQQELAEAETDVATLTIRNVQLAKQIVEHDKMLYLVNQEQCENERLREQLTASQAEVSRLEDLYNSDRVSYLDDITLLQSEVERFRSQRDELGDSLYKKSPDSAEFYDYTPTWRRDDPR